MIRVDLSAAMVDAVEITDAVVSPYDDAPESIIVGSARISTPDLDALAVEVAKFADRLADVVAAAYAEAHEASLVPCWCGTRIPPDDPDCGSKSCRQQTYNDAEAGI